VSSFTRSGDAYGRFMGRYSEPLAEEFAAWARFGRRRVLDVGCGPGALTAALADLVGADHVAAVDPAEQFVAACRERVTGADVRRALAEELPFGDASFGAALSQLVLNFVGDPRAAGEELRRVVAPGGVVAACTWVVRGVEMLNVFWDAAEAHVDPDATDAETLRQLRTPESLAAWAEEAGLENVETTTLSVAVDHAGFEDFWAPMTAAFGPVGTFYDRISDDVRAGIRERCRASLGDGPFTLRGTACAVRGRVPGG
jgi:ubiquinone/menaquinone biosynthesis C-methylase UbiE